MALSEDQRRKLEERALADGIDAGALIAAAEQELAGGEPGGEPSGVPGSGVELPKLFQYHLPFVRVREVRRRWLGLTEAFPGDEAIASEWSMQHGGEGPAAPDGAGPDET